MTTLVLLVVQTGLTILAVCGTIHADPEGKTTVSFESSVEEVHRGENDDNAVIIDGECRWIFLQSGSTRLLSVIEVNGQKS